MNNPKVIVEVETRLLVSDDTAYTILGLLEMYCREKHKKISTTYSRYENSEDDSDDDFEITFDFEDDDGMGDMIAERMKGEEHGRLIDADALIEELRKDGEAVYSHVFSHVECDEIDRLSMDLEQFVNNQPTIEAVPVVHGEWDAKYDYEDFIEAYCSLCGKKSEYMYKYCPNCGADMRKGGNG